MTVGIVIIIIICATLLIDRIVSNICRTIIVVNTAKYNYKEEHDENEKVNLKKD